LAGTTGPTIFSCPTSSALALALIYGEAGNRLFADGTLRNAAIQRLMKRVKASGRDSLKEEETLKELTTCLFRSLRYAVEFFLKSTS
jgi:hypothetical protein